MIIGIAIARYIASGADAGTLDTSFNSDGDIPGVVVQPLGGLSTANAISFDSNESIILAGSVDNQYLLLRYLSTGVLDTDFIT